MSDEITPILSTIWIRNTLLGVLWYSICLFHNFIMLVVVSHYSTPIFVVLVHVQAMDSQLVWYTVPHQLCTPTLNVVNNFYWNLGKNDKYRRQPQDKRQKTFNRERNVCYCYLCIYKLYFKERKKTFEETLVRFWVWMINKEVIFRWRYHSMANWLQCLWNS